MLNELQTVTVRAFLTALGELNSPLPKELQAEVNQVGEIFLQTPSVAADRLLELAKSDCLQEVYQQARMDIQQQYETQEQNRFDKPNQQNQPTTAPPERIANIAIAILKADDSSAEAKKHKPLI